MPAIDYRSVFESLPTPCALLDPDFVIIAVSRSYCRCVNRARDDLLGKVIFVAFPDNPLDAVSDGSGNLRTSLQTVLATRAPDTMAVQRYDIPCALEDGSQGFEERFWSPVNSPVFGDDGELKYIFHRARDVTEFMQLQQRDAQLAQVTDRLRDQLRASEIDVVVRAAEVQKNNRELRSAYARLDRLDQERTQFFANVSHELRTPISLILWPTSHLAEHLHDPQDRRDLEVIRTNALQLLRQVNALLDASKLEAGQMTLQYAQADAALLMQAAVTLFEPWAKEHGIVMKMELPESMCVQTDIEKFQVIITNLLSNAFKYTPTQGTIRCGLRREGPLMVLEVADSGPGVPQNQRQAVFDRFHQVDGGQTRRKGGTGLGLSIVRDFAKLMGGDARVEVAPEGGALFVVRLTKRAPENAEVTEGPATIKPAAWMSAKFDVSDPALERTSLPAKLRGLPRILIVEDNPEVQRFLRESLCDEYDIACADNGRLGLQAMAQFRPDSVICDVMMPEMTGPEMLRAVKQQADLADIPILFLTAKTDDTLRLSLLGEGAHDYLVKPFPIQELRARLTHAVSLQRVRSMMQKELESSVKDLETLAAELAAQKRKARALYNTTQEALNARSEFLTVAAHELRTPITALQLQLERLRRRAGALHGDQLIDQCDRLTRQGERLTLLVNELLDASALEHGKMSLHLDDVDLREVARDICRTAPAVAAGCNVPELRVHADMPVHGHWDKLRLEQIVINLLSNAIKYGGGAPVDVSVTLEGDEGVLSVQDHGPGIAPDDHKRIFERFERSVSMRNISGLGMGLYIVSETVSALGGTIEVISDVGRGAAFIVRLPLAGPDNDQPATPIATEVEKSLM